MPLSIEDWSSGENPKGKSNLHPQMSQDWGRFTLNVSAGPFQLELRNLQLSSEKQKIIEHFWQEQSSQAIL